MTRMATGIARAALEACITRAKNRRHPFTGEPVTANPVGMIHLGSAAARIQTAETIIRGAAARTMNEVTATGTVADTTRVRIRLDYAFGVYLYVEAAEELFRASGASTLDEHSPIQQCWRNVHAGITLKKPPPPGERMITAARTLRDLR